MKEFLKIPLEGLREESNFLKKSSVFLQISELSVDNQADVFSLFSTLTQHLLN